MMRMMIGWLGDQTTWAEEAGAGSGLVSSC